MKKNKKHTKIIHNVCNGYDFNQPHPTDAVVVTDKGVLSNEAVRDLENKIGQRIVFHGNGYDFNQPHPTDVVVVTDEGVFSNETAQRFFQEEQDLQNEFGQSVVFQMIPENGPGAQKWMADVVVPAEAIPPDMLVRDAKRLLQTQIAQNHSNITIAPHSTLHFEFNHQSMSNDSCFGSDYNMRLPSFITVFFESA